MVMVVNIKGKDVELKYSFNSFKYMRDLDMGAINDIENRPFEVVPMLVVMVLGAVNNDRKVKFTEAEVEEFIEEFIKEGSISEFIAELMELLQESNFFKSLQRETKAKAK